MPATQPPRSPAPTPRPSAPPRLQGCRVVTTSLTARLLIRHQLQALDDVDWTLVSGDAYDDAPPGLHVDVVPIGREFSPADVPAFFRLLRYFRRRRFDLVQTHTPKASFLGLPACRLTGARTIYTVHGALYFAGNARKANVLGWFFERWCCSWAHQVLVQSSEDEKAMPRARICPARKITYVGNGIQLDRFVAPSEPAIRSERPVVLMVSRLVREKGCEDFVAVARALSGQADFVHVGPFEHDQSDALSPAEIDEIVRSGLVTFIGSVDDVRPYLASADIVVLPSYREGIPRVAMEAAATGCPVVAYDIRGVREVIDPASGLLVPRGDVSSLTTVVGALLGDEERRRRLGQQSQDHVVSTFSEDLVVERLRRVYGAIHPRGRSRATAGGASGGATPARLHRRAGGAETERSPGTAVCLTVDVEDWYDGMAVLGHTLPKPKAPTSGLSALGRLLDEHGEGAKVTLFTVAKYAPEVRDELVGLAARGHEIASHGPDHGRLPADADSLLEWLRRGRQALEDLLQVPITGFRSPRFDLPEGLSLTHYRAVLAQAGFRYVSDTHQLGTGSDVKELPVLIERRVPIGGGSYQRLLPLTMVRSALERAVGPAVLYYHSYDFGATLPDVSSIRSLAEAKQLAGRGRIMPIFTRLVTRYGSETCADAAG
jgi:glycosyltransferase involved in cell wall biosynthesis/peptidoglycan/xylan/chitin deacetylase (PgdA/CDA1 family)